MVTKRIRRRKVTVTSKIPFSCYLTHSIRLASSLPISENWEEEPCKTRFKTQFLWDGLQLCLQSPFFCIMKPLMRLLNSSNKGIKSRILPIVSLDPWLLTQSQFTLCSKWSKGPITINLCHSLMGFWLKLVTSMFQKYYEDKFTVYTGVFFIIRILDLAS